MVPMLRSPSLRHQFETRYEPRYRVVRAGRGLTRTRDSGHSPNAGYVIDLHRLDRLQIRSRAELGIALIGLRKAWRDSADCLSLP